MADEVTRAFARSLRRLRAERGLTKKQLAEMAGINDRTVFNAETASFTPVLPTACAIAAALGTTVDAMVTEAGLGVEALRAGLRIVDEAVPLYGPVLLPAPAREGARC